MMTTETQTLPALTGTEKQIAWAEKIRAAQIADAEGYLAPILPQVHPYIAKVVRGLMTDMIASQTNAATWIDNRNGGRMSLSYRVQDAWSAWGTAFAAEAEAAGETPENYLLYLDSQTPEALAAQEVSVSELEDTRPTDMTLAECRAALLVRKQTEETLRSEGVLPFAFTTTERMAGVLPAACEAERVLTTRLVAEGVNPIALGFSSPDWLDVCDKMIAAGKE